MYVDVVTVITLERRDDAKEELLFSVDVTPRFPSFPQFSPIFPPIPSAARIRRKLVPLVDPRQICHPPILLTPGSHEI